jgi:hypothetical protein
MSPSETVQAKLRAKILPALPLHLARLRSEMFTQEDVDDLRNNVPCALIELCFGQVSDGMGHGQIFIIRYTPGLCHRPTGGVKDISDDGGRRKAAFLKQDTIEHTARAARASVSHPGHDGATLGQNVADDLFVRGNP